jgi:hypothetical protein
MRDWSVTGWFIVGMGCVERQTWTMSSGCTHMRAPACIRMSFAETWEVKVPAARWQYFAFVISSGPSKSRRFRSKLMHLYLPYWSPWNRRLLMPWATVLVHCSTRFCPMHGCTSSQCTKGAFGSFGKRINSKKFTFFSIWTQTPYSKKETANR